MRAWKEILQDSGNLQTQSPRDGDQLQASKGILISTFCYWDFPVGAFSANQLGLWYFLIFAWLESHSVFVKLNGVEAGFVEAVQSYFAWAEPPSWQRSAFSLVLCD